MTTLGDYHHDFPRLAKQSGYFFQLYRGRVNWSQIESLNINDIIENRNFHLLEQNLLNVINCNLEREYDLKVLDQNFVKLFKLAQLGVDYLSYCELYLDRCVILLQEQLLSLKEEYEAFKTDAFKKSEEQKKSKKKNRTQNYQCDKCEKIFISDVYLKFHDKRRHSNPNTPKSLDRSFKNSVDTSQQTEDSRKFTTSTQTVFLENDTCESDQMKEIKREHNLKIEKLESELEDLKTRLKKAETTLTEKAEASNSNFPSSYNFPGPIYYPPMLPFIPPYLPQSHTSFYELNSGYQASGPQKSRQSPQEVESKTETVTQVNIDLKETPTRDIDPPKESVRSTAHQELDNDKENIDPRSPVIKPLPLPRKTKNINLTKEEKTKVEPFTITNQTVTDSLNFNNQSITTSSTPIKETQVTSEISFGNTNERETISNESLNSKETSQKPKSFITKMRNSPRLHNLSKNLKRSLTNLYDSVSVSGKESGKVQQKNSNSKTVDALNSELRDLGVDPEWTGIPEKTMKQKLKALKHKRKLLSRENPMYPVVRQNIEEKILQKLRQKFTMKKPNHTNEQESIETPDTPKPEEEKPKKTLMYGSDSDTETKLSHSEENLAVRESSPRKTILIKDLTNESESEDEKPAEKPFDLSVFQIRTKNVTEVPKKEVPIVDDLLTDSDFDDDFLENFQNQHFEKAPSTDKPKSEDGEGESSQFMFLNSSKEKAENQSILKSNQGTESRVQFNSKKKVFFASPSDEAELSDFSASNDDICSLKSDWNKDVS